MLSPPGRINRLGILHVATAQGHGSASPYTTPATTPQVEILARDGSTILTRDGSTVIARN